MAMEQQPAKAEQAIVGGDEMTVCTLLQWLHDCVKVERVTIPDRTKSAEASLTLRQRRFYKSMVFFESHPSLEKPVRTYARTIEGASAMSFYVCPSGNELI